MRRGLALVIAFAAACGRTHALGDAAVPASDAPRADAAVIDANEVAADAGDDASGTIDGGGAADASAATDAHGTTDAATTDDASGATDASGTADAHGTTDAATTADAGGGPITGGPCLSGAAGATAYRVRWIDAGGTAQVSYEVDGFPDKSRDKAGAYGYQIGFTPSFVDPFLGAGGVALDSSDFIDLELSTAGLAQITSATLSIYGRSYDTTASGSFDWQTFDGDQYNQTATDFVSNVAPYQWYSADMTAELAAGNAGDLIRIKAGPSSGSLVVNRIELCVVAN
jgi:hypothetical protein